MPELNQPDPTEPTEIQPTEQESPQEDAPASVRDNWYWQPAVFLVMGVVIALLQKQYLTGSGGHLLNWVVAGLGAALAVVGLVRLVREYPR